MTFKSRIAFGSCNDQGLQNHLWPVIMSRNPAAFIWGGDAIYADWSSFPPKSEVRCASPQRLRALYREQLSTPGYRTLLEQNITIFGTFDDHDFGCNNGDRTYQYKYESGLAYVDFLGESEDSAMRRRAQEGHGVYGVKLFDFSRSPGNHVVPEEEAGIDPDILALPTALHSFSNRTVAVFVLDVRTHKTPWKQGINAYAVDYEGDFLGQRQWEWFETAVRRSHAAVNVVVNGLQVHANIFPNGNIAEGWSKYPNAQARLFDALLQDGVKSPILISGDVHMTQLMRKDCVRRDKTHQPPRPLIEMTTSGMTHSWGTMSSRRIGWEDEPTWRERYESFVARSTMEVLHYVSPWTSLMKSDRLRQAYSDFSSGGAEGARNGLQFSLEKNFGELEFDWENRIVAMRTFGERGSSPLLNSKISMDQLSGISRVQGFGLKEEDFVRESKMVHPAADRDWICINHRGRENHLYHMIGHLISGVVLTIVVPVPFLIPCVILLLVFKRFYQKKTGNARSFTMLA